MIYLPLVPDRRHDRTRQHHRAESQAGEFEEADDPTVGMTGVDEVTERV
jgi:hypothetical protein